MSRRPRYPRYSGAALVRRQLLAEPGTALLVGATVLLVSLVLSLWPRAVDSLLGEDLHEQLDSLTPAQRDLTGHVGTWQPSIDTHGDVDGVAELEAFADWLEGERRVAGQQLADLLGTAEVTATRGRDPIDKGPHADDVVAETLAVRVDQLVGDRVRLVEGRLPGIFDLPTVFTDAASFSGALAENPVEVVVSVDTADRMRWRVGEVREMGGVIPFRIHLVGTFEALDPAAGYWSHLESTLFPYIIEDGNFGTTVNGIAYADVSALDSLAVADGLELDWWYPVDTAAAAGTDRTELLRELRAFVASTRMTTELTDRLEAATERQATFTTVLDVLAVGPVGVALGVLWLAAVLAADRRRGALGLAAARGGSGTGIRAAMAARRACALRPAVMIEVYVKDVNQSHYIGDRLIRQPRDPAPGWSAAPASTPTARRWRPYRLPPRPRAARRVPRGRP